MSRLSRILRIRISDIPNEQSYGTRYLYVIAEAGTEYPVKIGRADNPIWRRSALQAGNHRELELLAAWVGDREAIIRLELELHAQFRAFRVAREWFEVSPDYVCKTIAEICQ